MSSIADQANRVSAGILWRPRARAARVIPLRFIVTIALVLVAIVALLCLAAALYGYRDGYSQGWRDRQQTEHFLHGGKS